MSVNLEYSTLYIVLEEQDPKNCSLRIRNDLLNVDIQATQKGVKASEGITVPAGQTVAYAWLIPNWEKQVHCDFTVEGSTHAYKSADNRYSWEDLQYIYETNIPTAGGDRIRVYTQVQMEGNSRILRFYVPEDNENQRQSQFTTRHLSGKEVISMNVEVTLLSLGFSIITNVIHKEELVRREVLYM
mmetsp:Transcript_20208/g.17387  ORF Transcript_20208/g.17387 Transcript_20208/m.17387 type:complete len:186 (+) Transcript_20208:3298-3855(+)